MNFSDVRFNHSYYSTFARRLTPLLKYLTKERTDVGECLAYISADIKNMQEMATFLREPLDFLIIV